MTTRIGFDTASAALVLVGEGVFPAGTLSAAIASDGQIQIQSLAMRMELVKPWSEIASLDGVGFADAGSALAYLQGEFAKRAASGSPERAYALPPARGQPVFPLSPEPVDVNSIALVINGVAYYPPDIAVSALAVTWQGPFPLDMTDAARVVYF